MELHIVPEFEAVFFINGAFYENTAHLYYDEISVVYVTVMPLKASLLPYTVKLAGTAPVDAQLYKGYRLGGNHYYLKLLPRYIHFFAPNSATEKAPSPSNAIFKLFEAVKSKNFKTAMELLTPALKQTIDESALESFFKDYCDIIPNDGYAQAPGTSAFMINTAGNAELYSFKIKDGLIDDIVNG